MPTPLRRWLAGWRAATEQLRTHGDHTRTAVRLHLLKRAVAHRMYGVAGMHASFALHRIHRQLKAALNGDPV